MYLLTCVETLYTEVLCIVIFGLVSIYVSSWYNNVMSVLGKGY